MDNTEVIKEILLTAKKEVFNNNFGAHITTLRGEGVDFKEIKDYEVGDDIRRINWIATAKNPQHILQVNQFNDEKELNIILVFLVSGSINFGSIKLKQDIMNEILAILAYSASKNNDSFTTIFYSKEEEKLFKPTKNSAILEEIITYGVNLDPINKEVNYDNLCKYINSLKQKSLIFLIGDFLDDNIDLSSISYKNEVYALVVRDEFEENLTLKGEYNLINPNSLKEDSFILNDSVINSYKELLKQKDQKLIEHFLEHKIKYEKIYTNDDVFMKLFLLLK